MVRKHHEGEGPDGEKTTVQLIHDGDIDLVINTPHGSLPGGSARVDGYEIRTAAVLADIPCITTVQGLGAAVQGIEAMTAARSVSAACRTGRGAPLDGRTPTGCCSTTS